MVRLTIQGQQYKFPERLTLAQWKELIPYDYRDHTQWPTILGKLLKQPKEIFEKATFESLTLAISFVIAIMNTRQESKIKDFNDMKFGEFVDLDIYTIEGMEKRIDDALEIICDPKPYMADEALWCIDQFSLFRQHTYRSYAGLFGLNDLKDEDYEEEAKNWDAKKIAKGWYNIIVDLADSDLLKVDAVTEEPLKKTLNFMAHKKEKQLEENFRQLQQKRKYDLSRNR